MKMGQNQLRCYYWWDSIVTSLHLIELMWMHCGTIIDCGNIIHGGAIVHRMALVKVLGFLRVIYRLIVRHGMVELRVAVDWLSEFALWGHVWRLAVHVRVHVLGIYLEWHLFWHHLILLRICSCLFVGNLN